MAYFPLMALAPPHVIVGLALAAALAACSGDESSPESSAPGVASAEAIPTAVPADPAPVAPEGEDDAPSADGPAQNAAEDADADAEDATNADNDQPADVAASRAPATPSAGALRILVVRDVELLPSETRQLERLARSLSTPDAEVAMSYTEGAQREQLVAWAAADTKPARDALPLDQALGDARAGLVIRFAPPDGRVAARPLGYGVLVRDAGSGQVSERLYVSGGGPSARESAVPAMLSTLLASGGPE